MNFDKSWIMIYVHHAREEENFDNVLRIFPAYWGISRVRLTRFEQLETKIESQACVGKRCLHDAVNPGLLEKQQRQQVRQQQSYVSTSENEVQLQKRKRIPSRGQIDYNSWMTDFDTMMRGKRRMRASKMMPHFQY